MTGAGPEGRGFLVGCGAVRNSLQSQVLMRLHQAPFWFRTAAPQLLPSRCLLTPGRRGCLAPAAGVVVRWILQARPGACVARACGWAAGCAAVGRVLRAAASSCPGHPPLHAAPATCAHLDADGGSRHVFSDLLCAAWCRACACAGRICADPGGAHVVLPGPAERAGAGLGGWGHARSECGRGGATALASTCMGVGVGGCR